MLSIMILPNFKGTRKEFIQATFLTLLLDSIYIIPIFNHIIK